jgi:hypothetical protein
MKSYRFSRRAFLSSVGGAFALHIMLRNFEAMAQGATSPPRFLMTHWPVGTVKYLFLPNGGGAPSGVGSITEFSGILKPFETAGLGPDMSLIWGLRDTGNSGGGGGHEAGTPMTTTGTSCPGTRQNGGEGDDGVAGGPSWDQVFLEETLDDAAAGTSSLKRPGIGYVNAICDERIDSQETSTRCLSYGYQTQQIQSVNPGGTITEHVPLLPELSPAQLYMKLFTGFMPGGATPGNMETAKRALQGRKSVLDYCMPQDRNAGERADQRRDRHAERVRRPSPARSRARRRQRLEVRLHESDDQHGGRRGSPRDRQATRRDHSRRVPMRHRSRGHVPVVAGHEPRVVQGTVSG